MWRCPNCQRELPMLIRIFGTPIGRKFDCSHCYAQLCVRKRGSALVPAALAAIAGLGVGVFVSFDSPLLYGVSLGAVIFGVALLTRPRLSTVVVLHAHHPTCQRCGYDLYENQSGVCPEWHCRS